MAVTVNIPIENAVTDGSLNPVTSNAVFDGLAGKASGTGTANGTNTGDETQSTIKTKLGSASGSTDGYLLQADWNTFNGKQDALGFTPENVANKQTDLTASATKYPTVDAVNTGLAAKQDKLFIHKETTPSAAVTGTTVETEVYKVTIPANTFASGDKLVIDNFIAAKVGVNGLVTFRFKLSTSATIPVGTTDRIADPQMAITNLSFFAARKFNITGGNIIGVNVGVTSPQSELLTGSPITTTPFDPTVINYLYVSVILAHASDSVVVHGFTIKNF